MKRKLFMGILILELLLFIFSIILKMEFVSKMIFCILILSLLIILIKKYCNKNRIKINYFQRFKKTPIKKVSVVIPNYNYANYIGKRIESIVNQSYPIYELIILDDCSTDNSVRIIENIVNNLKKVKPDIIVKFVKNKKNSGCVFKQWQKAFELSTGDYLWIAEADDLCSKYFLNVAMQGFLNDDVALSFTESKGIDEEENVIYKDFRVWTDPYKENIFKTSFVKRGNDFINESLAINNSITNASAVIFDKRKNNNFIDILKSAQQYRLSGDWYFYANYIKNYSISYSSDSLNYHRVHQGSVTNTLDKNLKIEEVERVQKVIMSTCKISKNSQKKAGQFVNELKNELCSKES